MEVTTPDNLDDPILQTRVMTTNGMRTVAPLGTWTDAYSSSEIYKNMVNFGYKIKIFRGYLFDRKVMFNDFVKYFFEMKASSKKDNPRYYIPKLMMNSL